MSKLKLSKPSKLERLGLIVTVLMSVLIWILANQLYNKGIEYSVHFLSNLTIKATSLLWIAVALYHVGLFTIATRSILVNQKNTIIDAVFMLVGILGVMLVLISLVGFYYFKVGQIDWFFGIQQSHLFYTGLILEIITNLYYAFTE